MYSKLDEDIKNRAESREQRGGGGEHIQSNAEGSKLLIQIATTLMRYSTGHVAYDN